MDAASSLSPVTGGIHPGFQVLDRVCTQNPGKVQEVAREILDDLIDLNQKIKKIDSKYSIEQVKADAADEIFRHYFVNKNYELREHFAKTLFNESIIQENDEDSLYKYLQSQPDLQLIEFYSDCLGYDLDKGLSEESILNAVNDNASTPAGIDAAPAAPDAVDAALPDVAHTPKHTEAPMELPSPQGASISPAKTSTTTVSKEFRKFKSNATEFMLLVLEHQANVVKVDGPKLKTKVRSCIKGYAKPTGVFERLQWIGYRIWNAVKSIFGQSDWQVAREALVDFRKACVQKTGQKFSPDEIKEGKKKADEDLLDLIACNGARSLKELGSLKIRDINIKAMISDLLTVPETEQLDALQAVNAGLEEFLKKNKV